MNASFNANRFNSIVYVDDTTAIVTKAFAKKAVIFGSPEFQLWREYKAMFPKATMHTKSIKRNPSKRVETRNMTYKNMADYIRTMDNCKQLMAEFERVCIQSKVQTNPYRCVLAWFVQTCEGYDGYKAYFEGLTEERKKENNIFYLEPAAAPHAVKKHETDELAVNE